jgi:predicted metal-binding membrane protein
MSFALANSRRGYFLPILGGLVALAWLALAVWADSPYGRYLQHGGWTNSVFLEICRALPAGELILPAALYVLGWLLMIAAMMLPTTFPLLDTFQRLVKDRADRGALLVRVIAGYFAAWALFGILAHAADAIVHGAARRSAWLTVNGWVFGAAALAVAGVFQFSPLKYRCLDKCRTPLSFVQQHWRGRNERRNAWLLGLHHGAFCVGCCWALMLLMFAVGTGSVGWMLAMGVVMAVEKNLPWGRWLSAPLGAALLAAAVVILVQHAGRIFG